jgi:hypothetical protein
MKAPICPLCKINECDFDSEPPGPGSYSTHCTRCFFLITSAEHNHTIYPSPAQVAAGTFRAGHSWRTSQLTHPIMENGVHVGYRCAGYDRERCGWERRFTAEDMEPCEVTHKGHSGWPLAATLRHQCHRMREHRIERGEVDERGYITDHGRAVEAAHGEATTWDPGGHFERV